MAAYIMSPRFSFQTQNPILFNVAIHFSENLVSHLDNVYCLMIFVILINRLLDPHAVCSDVVRRNKNLIKFWHGSQIKCGRRRGLMVSELDSGSRGPGSSWARHSDSASLHPIYKWVPANLRLGITLRWTSIPSKGWSSNIPSRLMLQKPG